MNNVNAGSILSSVHFEKQGAEISVAGNKKVKALEAKIKEREARISKIREENEITDKDLVQLMRLLLNGHQSHSNMLTYSTFVPVGSSAASGSGREGTMVDKQIPAGVVQNLNTEQEAMENEMEQVKRLKLILRNVNLESKHEVSHFDLEYLGF